MQGVAAPDLRLTQEAKDGFDAWILKNGLRWTAEGGPLAEGGVDVAFIGWYLAEFPLILYLIAFKRRPPNAWPHPADQEDQT